MDDLDLRLSWSHESGDDDLSWTDTVETYDPDEGFQIPETKLGLGVNMYEDLCRGTQVRYREEYEFVCTCMGAYVRERPFFKYERNMKVIKSSNPRHI
jgi:hypothetical protein